MKNLTVYEWMCLNVDKLVVAIRKDGSLAGPTSDPMLAEAQKLDGPREKARNLLHIKLRQNGLGHLIEGE